MKRIHRQFKKNHHLHLDLCKMKMIKWWKRKIDRNPSKGSHGFFLYSMGFGIVWVLYFVYLTRNIGVSPPQPLEPGSAQEELLRLGQLLVARFFNETLEELMNLLTCCLFAGWSDLWVGGVCENPFFRRVFVRISWTQNGRKHFVIFGAGWQIWCASFFGIFPHPKGNGRYRSLEGSPNSILWGKRWVFGGREGPLKFLWVWIQRPKIDGVYTPGN